MALLLSLLLLPLLVILAFTLTTLGVQNVDVSRSKADSRIAMYVSEAGAEEAVQLLKSDLAYEGSFSSRGTGRLSTAKVVVTNNRTGERRVASNGTVIPRGHAYVVSTARILGQRNAPNPNLGVTRQTGCLVRLSGTPGFRWSGAVYAVQGVKLGNGASTDAFRSSVGYEASKNFQRGSVGSPGPVVVQGEVGGDLHIGEASRPALNEIVPRVRGTIVAMTLVPSTRAVEVVPPAARFRQVKPGTLTPGNDYGDVSVHARDTIVLQSGNYTFNSFTLNGGKVRVAPGATATVTVREGAFNLAPGSVVAGDVTVELGPSVSTARIRGTATMRLYAPHTNVTVAGRVLGQVVGKHVTLAPQARVSFDEDAYAHTVAPDAVVVQRQQL